MKHDSQIPVIFHIPQSKDAQQELARQMARIQADAILAYIHSLSCPTEQKLRLLDAVIALEKSRMQDRVP